MNRDKRVEQIQAQILLNPVSAIPISRFSFYMMGYSSRIMAESIAGYEEDEKIQLDYSQTASVTETVAETLLTLQDSSLATIFKDYRSRAERPFGGYYNDQKRPDRNDFPPKEARVKWIKKVISDDESTKDLLLKIQPNAWEESAFLLASSIARCEELAEAEFDDMQLEPVAERVAHAIVTFNNPMLCKIFRDYCGRAMPLVGGHYEEEPDINASRMLTMKVRTFLSAVLQALFGRSRNRSR